MVESYAGWWRVQQSGGGLELGGRGLSVVESYAGWWRIKQSGGGLE